MAAETSTDAHLPVSIVLLKLHLELFWEKIYLTLFSSSTESTASTQSTTTTPPTTTNEDSPTTTTTTTLDLESAWDLYLMAGLLSLIGVLYTMRRQRAAFLQQQQQQPPPVQAPVQ